MVLKLEYNFYRNYKLSFKQFKSRCFSSILNSNRELKKEFMKKVRKLVKNKEAKDINVAKKMIKKEFLKDYPEIKDYCSRRYDEYEVLKKKINYIKSIKLPIPKKYVEELNSKKPVRTSIIKREYNNFINSRIKVWKIWSYIANELRFKDKNFIRVYLRKINNPIYKEIQSENIVYRYDIIDDKTVKKGSINKNYITKNYYIKKIKRNLHFKFITIYIGLDAKYTNGGKSWGHTNFVLINTVNKEIFHYEPHGILINNKKLSMKIDKKIRTDLYFLIVDGYKYNSHFLNFKKLGIQSNLGLCTIYSFYHMIYLIINSTENVSYSILVRYLLRKLDTEQKINRYIRHFLWFNYKLFKEELKTYNPKTKNIRYLKMKF